MKRRVKKIYSSRIHSMKGFFAILSFSMAIVFTYYTCNSTVSKLNALQISVLVVINHIDLK